MIFKDVIKGICNIFFKKKLLELIPPVRIFNESDKWKRIRYDDDEINEGISFLSIFLFKNRNINYYFLIDVETLYSNVMQHVMKNYENSTYRTIVDSLLDIKCCARCVFRFLGVRDYKCYATSEEVTI